MTILFDFQNNLVEFENDDVRTENVAELCSKLSKRASELLSEEKTQLSEEFERFLEELIYSKIEYQEITAVEIIINVLNMEEPIIEFNLLEPYVLELCNNKCTCQEAARLIPVLYTINKEIDFLEKSWEEVENKFESNSTKEQAAAILTYICEFDISRAKMYCKFAWESQSVECYCELLLNNVGIELLIEKLPKEHSLDVLREFLLRMECEKNTLKCFNENYEIILKQLIEKPKFSDIFGLMSRFNFEIFDKYIGRIIAILIEEKNLMEISIIVQNIDEEAIRPLFSCIFTEITRQNFSKQALTCIKALASKCKSLLNDNIQGIEKEIFEEELSNELIEAIKALEIPSLEEKLLELLAVTISGVAQFGINKNYEGIASNDVELALYALLQFEFCNNDLTNFCIDHVSRYLTSDDKNIRKLAGEVIIKHIKPNEINNLINQVVTEVLVVALTDMVPEVRVSITEFLSEDDGTYECSKFDNVLAEEENIDLLFLSTSDESFGVKQNIFKVIGRISKINPTNVLPKIREIFLSLIYQLNEIKLAKNIRQEQLELMNILVCSCQSLIETYYLSACNAIFTILDSDDDIEIELALLIAMRLFYSEEVEDNLPEIIKYINKFLDSKNSKVKGEALSTLKSIVMSSGFPIVPYYISKTMLSKLVETIKTDDQNSKLAVSTLITLGAVKDVTKLEINEEWVKKFKIDKCVAKQESDIIPHGKVRFDPITNAIIDVNEIIKQKFYYKKIIVETPLSLIIFNNIIEIFSSKAGENIEYQAAILMRKQIETIDPDGEIMNNVIHQLLALISSTEKIEFKEMLIKELVIIVSCLKKSVLQFCPDIIAVLVREMECSELLIIIFSALEEIISELPDINVIQINYKIVDKLLQIYSSDSYSDKVIIKSYNLLILLINNLQNQIILIIPSILKIFKRQGELLHLATLDIISRIVVNSTIDELVSLIISTLLEIMKNCAKPLISLNQNNTMEKNKVGFKAFETLQICACQLNKQFCPFICEVNEYMVEFGYYSVFFNCYITLLLNNIDIPTNTAIVFCQQYMELEGKLDDSQQELVLIDRELPEMTLKTTDAEMCEMMQSYQTPEEIISITPYAVGFASLPQNESDLDEISSIPEKDWKCNNEQNPQSWRQWIENFMPSLIFYSPDPRIHNCYELARVYNKLAKQLFNFAFLSYIQDNNNVIELRKTAQQTLISVFTSTVIPEDIQEQFLDLVEFLELNESNKLDLDEFNLANISDRCNAFARSLRFKENGYYKNQSKQSIDALINANYQLQQYESIKGLIHLEQKRAGNTFVNTLFNIIEKQITSFMHEADGKVDLVAEGSSATREIDEILDEINQEDRNLLKTNISIQKANPFEGTIGGVFLEGREVNSQQNSQYLPIDYNNISRFLEGFIIEKIGAIECSEINRQHIIEKVISNILSLEDLMQLEFGLKPKYYEYLHEYDIAQSKYIDQISLLMQLIHEKDISRMSIEIKQHQHLYIQYIQCLFNMGQYEKVLSVADEYLNIKLPITEDIRNINVQNFQKCVASYCVQSAYKTKKMTFFTEWLELVNDPEKSLFMVLQLIQQGKCCDSLQAQQEKFNEAKVILDSLFDNYHPIIMSSIFESYERSQPELLLLEDINEIYEAIDYLSSPACEESGLKKKLSQIWQTRLEYAGHSTFYLQIRELVFTVPEDYKIYLQYADDCIKQRNYDIAMQIYELFENEKIVNEEIMLAKARFLYKTGQAQVAQELLDQLTQGSQNPRIRALAYSERGAQCCEEYSGQGIDSSFVGSILANLARAEITTDQQSVVTVVQGNALALLEQAVEIDAQNLDIQNQLGILIDDFLGNAADRDALLARQFSCYCECVKNGKYVFQNLLKCLELWYTHQECLTQAFSRELAGFNREIFLEVIPQLLSKKHNLVIQTLTELSLQYPRLLAIPLICATFRQDIYQKEISNSILIQLKRSNQDAIAQIQRAQMELIGIATLRTEYVQDRLYQIIQEYNEHKNQLVFYNQLAIVIDYVRQPPISADEKNFNDCYYKDLMYAFETLRGGILNNQLQAVESAKQALQEVHKKLVSPDNRKIFELEKISPYLAELNNTDIPLFGQNDETLTIHRIFPQLNIMNSKQKPRKMAFIASDGELYAYLLKGREDLREDERIMQLFHLENSLFETKLCQQYNIKINRYPIIPLGKTEGLIFWVPEADQMHELIKQQRLPKNIKENKEAEEFKNSAGEYEKMSLQMKINAFKLLQQKSSASDIKDAIWITSTSAEDWLRRRTNFTVTLAAISACGHIIGLNDRHPENLLITKQNSEIYEIDYGDAFEAAARRARLPEKVPFRLTRMLTNALEAAGVHGLFEQIMNETLKICRKEHMSILSLMQTFLEDELVREDDITPELIVDRVKLKLQGKEFGKQLTVEEEVELLIQMATNVENICQSYIGWCPFW